jgi:hypothetical protein
MSLLHLVEPAIIAERLVTELEGVFTPAGDPPKVLSVSFAGYWSDELVRFVPVSRG